MIPASCCCSSARIPLLLISFLVLLQFSSVLGQCPRKLASTGASPENEGTEEGEEAQPGFRPAKQFIQTSFIHRDHDDVDVEYAQLLTLKLAELRTRLLREALLSLDNENIDCSGSGEEGKQSQWEFRCREYPLDRPFHFLVVEDSRTGAAVYSLPRERNWAGASRSATLGRLEMSLLDAFSRHSLHPLMVYASEEASAHLGFVRELSSAELEGQMRENHEKMAKKRGSKPDSKLAILTRSPLEVRLLNERILANRLVDFPLDGVVGILDFQGPELAEMIESPGVQAVFVLFWSNSSQLSQHAFHLWAKSARGWRQRGGSSEVIFGAVECQGQAELCRAFGIAQSEWASGSLHQLMAFRDGQRLGQQLAIGPEEFLLEWVHLLLAGPLLALSNMEQVTLAKEGILPGWPGQVPAVTIGQFRDEQQEEFRRFRRAAALLAGRYHFAYWLEPGRDEARLSTFARQMAGGGMAEQPYLGTFDTGSLLSHITHASMPAILDIGHGFTTDLVLSAEPALLLMHDSSSYTKEPGNGAELREHFSSLGYKLRRSKKAIGPFKIFELDRANSLPLAGLMREMGLEGEEENNSWPILCAMNLREIVCAFRVNEEKLAHDDDFTSALEAFMAREDVEEAEVDATVDDGVNDAGGHGEKEEAEGERHEHDIWQRHFPHKVSLNLAQRAHPLQQIQLEHVHATFGRQQQLPLNPEPLSELRRRKSHPHNFASLDSPAISGCPMMAQLNSARDEL